MAINITVFAHPHKWRRWFRYESGGCPVINNEIQEYRRGRFKRTYKCWRCGLTSDIATPERMKGMLELLAEDWDSQTRTKCKGIVDTCGKPHP